MRSTAYSRVSGLVFALVAVGHAVRAFRAVPLQIGATAVPVSASWAVAVAAALLSLWAFRSSAS